MRRIAKVTGLARLFRGAGPADGALARRFLGEASHVAISDCTTAAATAFRRRAPIVAVLLAALATPGCNDSKSADKKAGPAPAPVTVTHRRTRHCTGQHHGDRQRRADPDGSDQVADRRRNRRRARPRRPGRDQGPAAARAGRPLSAGTAQAARGGRGARPRAARQRPVARAALPGPAGQGLHLRGGLHAGAAPVATPPRLPSRPTMRQSRRLACSCPIPSCARPSADGPAR